MKTIFFLAVMLFTAIAGRSQTMDTHFGLKAGFNISSLKVDGGNDYKPKVGFHAGGLAHIHISTHFAVQPELLYSAQGGEDNNDSKLSLNYLNLPVLMQYMTGTGFRLQTGPQLGFLLSAKSKEGHVEVDVKNDLNTIDVSWSFGAGYLSPGGWGVDARYNIGLTNINENDFPEVKNRVFQAGVFYQFMNNYRRR